MADSEFLCGGTSLQHFFKIDVTGKFHRIWIKISDFEGRVVDSKYLKNAPCYNITKSKLFLHAANFLPVIGNTFSRFAETFSWYFWFSDTLYLSGSHNKKPTTASRLEYYKLKSTSYRWPTQNTNEDIFFDI